MEVRMSNAAPPAPRKVRVNPTKAVLDAFINSDKQFLSTACETIEQAKNLTVGAYNMCKRKGYDIQVWRNGTEVYMQKGATNNED